MSEDRSLVLVVDDDPYLREAIGSMMVSIGHEVSCFGSTEEFLASEPPNVPSCLVLDVRLPGRSGLELQQKLDEAGFRMPVIFITGHGDISMSVTAMKAGAIEFLAKPFRNQDFVDAVHRGIRLDRERRKSCAELDELRERREKLTPREKEVFELVAEGLPNKKVASRLGLSEMTVKVHRAQVMRKMQADSLADLVRMADRLAGLTLRA